MNRTTTRSRDGRDKARLFRQFRLSDEQRGNRRCDLDTILSDDQIEVCESSVANCGYAACLIRMPEGGGGIMIAAGQDRGRKRFSIAHELGHYHIPSHATGGAMLSCADSDMRKGSGDRKQREWEANDFATELLMPSRQFAKDIVGRVATLETVATLAAADMYDVSLTAAAFRLVETTREMCALVVAVNGTIEWAVCSDAWRFPLPERQRSLPSGSIAKSVASGESASRAAEEVDPRIWLSSANGRFRPGDDLRLFESTHAVPRLGQITSLLWAVDEA